MRTALPLAALALFGVSAAARAQSWIPEYDAGLRALAKDDYAEARARFQAAAVFRPEDQSGPTSLPGPPTERRVWRDGAPYSPNFLAAYALYKGAIAGAPGTGAGDATADLKRAAAEMETLLAKGQNSQAVYFFLNLIYGRTGQTEERQDLAKRFQARGGKFDFQIDQAALTPEDRGAIQALANPGTSGTTPGASNPTTIPTVNARDLSGGGNVAGLLPTGAVAKVPTKYALIIANADSRLPGASLSFALEDAKRMRDVLLASAGYEEENVVVVTNATAAGMTAAARDLAARAKDEGTLFFYFTGVGANVDDRDYLAGVDLDLPNDTTRMVRKLGLYQPFVEKGMSVFAFYQVNRPIVNGRYFGAEAAQSGRIAQSQATIPGESVGGIYQSGAYVGLYTDAMTGVLNDFRSNAVPVTEFAWQVFYRMRRGSSGITGGGGRQTPTLPTLNILGSDARF